MGLSNTHGEPGAPSTFLCVSRRWLLGLYICTVKYGGAGVASDARTSGEMVQRRTGREGGELWRRRNQEDR